MPHGTAYHDFNLVSAEESEKVIAAAKRALVAGELQYDGYSFSPGSCGNTKVLGQRFNDSVFLVSTEAPTSTEDIEFSVGFNAMAESRLRRQICDYY